MPETLGNEQGTVVLTPQEPVGGTLNLEVNNTSLPDTVSTEDNPIPAQDITKFFTNQIAEPVEEGVPEAVTPPANEIPPVTPQNTEPAPASTDWTEKESAYIQRIQALEAKTAAVEEFEKNPLDFFAKYVPQITLQQFDSTKFIADKLNEKYAYRDSEGNLIPFTPDPSKALIPGTPDYNYANDLNAFKIEAQEYLNKAQNSISAQEQEGKQRFDLAKQSVKTKYGMTDDTFDQKIWKTLESVDNGKALELMADAIMYKEQIETMKKNLQNGVTNNATLPGVTSVTSPSNIQLPREQEAFSRMFGAKQVAKAYNN